MKENNHRDNRKKKKTRHKFSTMYSTEAANPVKTRAQLSSFLLIRVFGNSQENIDALLSSNIFCFFSSNINENSQDTTNFCC